MEFKDYLDKIISRVIFIKNLYNLDEVKVSFDNLKAKQKSPVEKEIIYVKSEGTEQTAFFIFGIKYFILELQEQEFKRLLGHSSLNYKIYCAYNKLKKNSRKKKIKITDILNELHNKSKDSIKIHTSLKRILTLAYYFDWDLKRDSKDIEGDKFIEITNSFIMKLKQRYNFDQIAPIYENEKLFIFLNSKGKINIILKEKDSFLIKDIEKDVFPSIRKVFNIKKIIVEN